MWRQVFLGVAIALAACRKAEAPLPTEDARVEAHPRTPFGQLRRSIYDFTSARHPGIQIDLRDQGSAGSVRVELYGRHLTEPLEQLVVVHVASEEILIDDIAATDATSLADKAKARASGPADLAVVRVEDDVALATVVETLDVLRANGFERVTLSAIAPASDPAGVKGAWLGALETCPRPEWLVGSMAVLQLHANGRGGIGSITVVDQDQPGAGYEGAMCVSTQSFPAHAGARPYRLRMRFSD